MEREQDVSCSKERRNTSPSIRRETSSKSASKNSGQTEKDGRRCQSRDRSRERPRSRSRDQRRRSRSADRSRSTKSMAISINSDSTLSRGRRQSRSQSRDHSHTKGEKKRDNKDGTADQAAATTHRRTPITGTITAGRVRGTAAPHSTQRGGPTTPAHTGTSIAGPHTGARVLIPTGGIRGAPEVVPARVRRPVLTGSLVTRSPAGRESTNRDTWRNLTPKTSLPMPLTSLPPPPPRPV